jgi:predicted HicB family RNase H-like nuclease
MKDNSHRGGPVPIRERFADTLTIRVSPTMREDLERLAAEQDRSLGAVVRLALRNTVEGHPRT